MADQLTFDDFRRLALRGDLSRSARIGFGEGLRSGNADAILADLRSKLTHLDLPSVRVVDVGAGCGELTSALLAHGASLQQDLTLVDSDEVLAAIDSPVPFRKVAGRFPENVTQIPGDADVVLCYSVLQYVAKEGSLLRFLDGLLGLLRPGGQCLIGDVPNASMRRRFMAGPAGRAYHAANYGTDPEPLLRAGIDHDELNDGMIIGLLLRAREMGFHAFTMPQAWTLPMATRREDLLFVRPG
jgi:hypothetical protein